MRRRVLRGYNPCGQRLCTALRQGERCCIDWVRRKKLFCTNVCILMKMHYHTNVKNWDSFRAPLLAVAPFPRSLYTFPRTSGYWQQRSRAWCPCTPMSRAPKKTSISRSAAFKPVRVAALRRGEWCPILVQIYSSICTWLSLQTDYAIRPSWTPLCRGENNWRNNSPEKSGRLIGCTPGYQVTPCLCTLFHAGASGDSSPLQAFLRQGISWLLAPRGPHIALNEWESGALYTRQPLMWGWYHVNERVFSTHGSRWCGAGIMRMRGCPLHMVCRGAGIMWIREKCLPNMTAANEGLVS